MSNLDKLIAKAPRGPRLPFNGELVIQLSQTNRSPIKVLRVVRNLVVLHPCYGTTFTVEMETFWERYNSLTYPNL